MLCVLLCSVSFSQSALKSKSKFSLQGTVYKQTDSLQPKEIICGAIITIIGSDGSIFADTSDTSGKYYFNNKIVKANTSYEIKVEHKGFYGDKAKFSTAGVKKKKVFIVDFYLLPIIQRGDPLPVIYYDSAEWKLSESYMDSTESFIRVLKDNPGIVIEIGAHSDNPGSLEYNDSLSYLRVKAIADYFVKNGIDGDRLVPYVNGRRVPLKLVIDISMDGFTFNKGTILTEDFINKLDSEKQKNAAHKLNNRIEFKILRDNFVPKK